MLHVAFDYLKTEIFPRLDSAEHRVLLFCLLAYADRHGRRMFPGLERLAAECRRERVFVEGMLHDLLAGKLIVLDPMRAGQQAYATPVDLSLWKSGGKPVDNSPVSDPPDPPDPPERLIHQESTLRDRILLEALHAEVKMLKKELPSRGLPAARRRWGTR